MAPAVAQQSFAVTQAALQRYVAPPVEWDVVNAAAADAVATRTVAAIRAVLLLVLAHEAALHSA